ncbi:MAG: NDP-sugar synthase [Gemmatimonadaceae bacterium]|nr:NDP-sugar synthase [Gemmatimonadaceae bacterium]
MPVPVVDERPSGGIAAIVLSRGYGRRLDARQHLFRHPLLPVALKPLIQYPLRWLAASGVVARVVVSAQDATDEVREWARTSDLSGLQLDYWSDSYPRGAAGSVKDAARILAAERYVVLEGARLPQVNLAAVVAAHRQSGAAVTMVVETERRQKAGARARIPGGLYVFEQEILDMIPATGFQDIKQGLLELAHRANLPVNIFEQRGLTPTVVDFSTYGAVNRWIVETIDERRAQYAGFIDVGEGLAHPSAQISTGAVFIGPVLIGAGATIHDASVIVGPAVIGNGATVLGHATVARSVLMDGVRVGDWAHVDGSVVAPHVSVAARTLIEDRAFGVDRPTSRLALPAALAPVRAAWPLSVQR